MSHMAKVIWTIFEFMQSTSILATSVRQEDFDSSHGGAHAMGKQWYELASTQMAASAVSCHGICKSMDWHRARGATCTHVIPGTEIGRFGLQLGSSKRRRAKSIAFDAAFDVCSDTYNCLTEGGVSMAVDASRAIAASERAQHQGAQRSRSRLERGMMQVEAVSESRVFRVASKLSVR